MIVLVRWCYNADCHSVGRVPSSYPRGVRRPTALLCFYPMPFRTVTSVSLGSVRFGLLVSRSSSMSLLSLLFASQCAACSRFRFPPPFMFIYCSMVFCLAFFVFHSSFRPAIYFPFSPCQYFLCTMSLCCVGFSEVPKYVFYLHHGPFVFCVFFVLRYMVQ